MIAVTKQWGTGQGENRPAAAAQKTAVFGERSALLDCMRAAAILLVFVFHVTTRYPEASLDSVARFFHSYGFLGVDIFFPLSGFLITRFLLTSPKSDFVRTFFLRRAFRILPLYFLAIAIYVAGSLATGVGSDVIGRIWINILFLTGWVSAVEGLHSIPYSITWSLSVEEFAYLLIGLMAWFNRQRLPLLLVLATAFAIVMRIGLMTTEFGNPYYFPPARLDSITVGGLTAVLLTRRPSWTLPVLVAALAVSMVVLDPLTYTSVGLGACICIALVEGSPLRSVTNAPLRFIASIGFYSYFNYLFHFFAIEILFRIYERLMGALPPFWIATLLLLTLMQVLAMISFRLFEAPLMRFGRRFERRPAATVPAPSSPAGVTAGT